MDIPTKTLNDGVLMPVLGLGTWQMEGEVCLSATSLALKMGYTAIDTAYAYYNEKWIGEAVQKAPREKLFITSKLWREFHDPKKVKEACYHSLKDLKTDYLDLYLIHWPERKNMIEILEQMQRLKEEGIVRSIGVCNATIPHLKEIIRQKVSISNNQVEFHPFLNQDGLLKFCLENQIAVTAYCPIAQNGVSKDKMLVAIGEKYKKTAPQISLRWLHQKGLIVIPKGTSQKHLQENLEIFNFSLTQEEMAEIEKLNRNQRIVLPDFNEFDA